MDELIEHGDQGVGAFDGEAFLARKGRVQEALQALDLREPLQQRAALRVGQRSRKGP